MASDILELRWSVYMDGYELIESDPPDNWPKGSPKFTIKPVIPSGSITEYSVNDHPGLFRTFIDLIKQNPGRYCDPEKALSFANKYGLLKSTNGEEDLIDWTHSSEMMFRAVDIWDAATNCDVKLLKQYIDLQEEEFKLNIPMYPNPEYTVYVSPFPKSHNRLIKWPKNEMEAAYHIIPFLMEKHLGDSLNAGIFTNENNKGIEFRVNPKNLISALWLQLGLSVSRNENFRKCKDIKCSTYFEVGKKRRYEKRYCSPTCRKRSERRNKPK